MLDIFLFFFPCRLLLNSCPDSYIVTLINYEFGLGANPYNGATTTERKEGFAISTAIGFGILLKTSAFGLSAVQN
jgi:hypothetical protein